LRPAPGLEALAAKIARVLVLRNDTVVELGPPPPPALLEAVPAGDVAMEFEQGGTIHLVMGAALGASYEARVDVADSRGEEVVRALALAIEALRDQAIENRARRELEPAPPAADAVPEPEPLQAAPPTAAETVTTLPPAPVSGTVASRRPTPSSRPTLWSRGQRDDEVEAYPRLDRGEHTLRVEPMLYLALYGGASTESNALRTGVSTGGGLCVLGQCVVLAVEYPLPINMEAGGGDVRYRYPTFSCSFYSRPIHFGRFTPAASIGLVSRIGHFERDMGVENYTRGLDTDLGVRGTLELAYEVVESIDVAVMGGLDYALDRWQFGNGDSLAPRGSRAAPWLQAGIRIRPH
jgi:hypothetical protein